MFSKQFIGRTSYIFTMQNNYIVVKGARVHNLQDVSVKIPRNKITVVTGISGSGKSSLAFDTIFAEGQRRYIESLSSYAKQIMGGLKKPDVDLIEGLIPALAIDQKSAARNPRSTVATMSEIYDYLRLLFVKIGQPHCPHCAIPLESVKKHIAEHKSHDSLFCVQCEQTFPRLSMGTFSFNNPQGACGVCQGLGKKLEIDPKLVVPNKRLTLAEGAIRPWLRLGSQEKTAQEILTILDEEVGIPIDKPLKDFTHEEEQILFYGHEKFHGVVAYLEQKHRETDSDYIRRELERYMIEATCSECMGKRYSRFALAVRIGRHSIADIVTLTVEESLQFFAKFTQNIGGKEKPIAEPIVRDIIKRISYLAQVGLGYLNLNRGADTLSGGEAQRVRLATQLGSQLTGVLYVLDEPSMGLHPHELNRLIKALKELRNNGNTILIVEHDFQLIQAADFIIDFGPGAGIKGGKIVAQGNWQKFLNSKNSLTAKYLRGEKTIARRHTTKMPGKFLKIIGASGNNLQNITVEIPLESLVCVSGVSGSGKTTLIRETLAKALAKHFHGAKAKPAPFKKIEGVSELNKIITIDQSPIGKTPRSNPATYTNAFSVIRDLYASLDLAKRRKYDLGRFSFNVKGGRCENCRGDGEVRFEMHFMPDVYVTCDECFGTRYNQAVLDVKYRNKSIADVLNMTVREALIFFNDQRAIVQKLKLLADVGLEYIQLGQSANTLSGGEAQRIKLASELARQDTGKTLYVLDEPTSGLHFEDINKLLRVLDVLVKRGNTVLIIEHNLDVIRQADWVIDLGPGAGHNGGKIVACGRPQDLPKYSNCLTGVYLQKYFPDNQLKLPSNLEAVAEQV